MEPNPQEPASGSPISEPDVNTPAPGTLERFAVGAKSKRMTKCNFDLPILNLLIMTCTPKGILLWILTTIWVLTLVGFSIAQFTVSNSFAETWGCRFWTIELTMVGLIGFFIIWTCVMTCFLLSTSPPPFLVLCFAIVGILVHLPNGITTIVDYVCGSDSLAASDYCTYSCMTLVVAIICTILGVLYAAVIAFILCCRAEEPPNE